MLLNQPDHREALTAMWEILFDSGNPGAAVDWLNKAIAVREDVPAVHYMLGCCFQAQRKIDDAVTAFARAVELDPNFAKAFNNLGCTLEAAGNLRGAFECYDRALELDPGLAVASYNKGNAFRQTGDPEQAIACMSAGLAIDPRHADWRCNLGDLLFERLELDEAVASYRAAIEIDTSYARAWAGLGLGLQGLGRNEEAESSLRKAIELDPKPAQPGSNLLLVLHNLHGDNPQKMFAEHAAWAKRHASGIPWQAARTEEERRQPGRLKIGYISPDFCRHPVGGFIEPVLAAHDRDRFQVFCYSTTTRPDETTRRLAGLCEHWRDVSRDSDDMIAERMRFDGIDILVELAGHTGGGRLPLVARKPAPVQVTWLGYPNTTGLRAIDYRFTDADADPPGSTDALHVEKLVRLPQGFLCYCPPAITPEPGEAAVPGERQRDFWIAQQPGQGDGRGGGGLVPHAGRGAGRKAAAEGVRAFRRQRAAGDARALCTARHRSRPADIAATRSLFRGAPGDLPADRHRAGSLPVQRHHDHAARRSGWACR